MNNFVKVFLLMFLIIFLVMYFSSGNGYYQYELNKKTNLTEEAIKRFEQDVKDGKEIDINDYLVNEKKDYSNNFSRAGLNLSNNIKKIFSEGVKLLFDSIGNLVDEE